MDYGVYRRGASNNPNVIYKRSVYSFGGKFSMSESEIRNELKGTLDNLDPDKKNRSKIKKNLGSAFGIWGVKQRVGMAAVFVMYFVLAVPCSYHLIQLYMKQTRLAEILRNLNKVEDIQKSTLSISKELECAICTDMSVSEQCSVFCNYPFTGNFKVECIGTETRKYLTQFNSDNGTNLFGESNQIFHNIVRSAKRCLMESIGLLNKNIPDSHHGIVEAIKTIKAAYLIMKQMYSLTLSCHQNRPMLEIYIVIRDLNYVMAHLSSLFISHDHQVAFSLLNGTKHFLFSVGKSTVFNVESANADDSESFKRFCEPEHIIQILELPVHMLQHIRNFVQKLFGEFKSDFHACTVQLVLYALVLTSLFLICFYEYFQLKKILLQMVELKYDNLIVSLCLSNEEKEFREVILELVPASKLREALQEETENDKDNGTESPDKDDGVKKKRSFASDLFSSPDPFLDAETDAVNDPVVVANSTDKKISRIAMTTIDEEKDYEIPESVVTRREKRSSNYVQEVTIFQSEIAGFNRMIQHITPAQLVNLVSYLIKLFDERVSLYDVYILSRDMNAYTVISGISSEQSSRHASEIINMALDIRAVCGDLEFEKGLQDSKLRLKIGIHTDSCYERLSVYPTPRYFISGDILYVTQKLRSSSPPSGIHVSEVTQQILSRNVAYNLQKYSTITTNTQQSIRTYVVVGRRVSEDIRAMDCPGRRAAWTPIQLEQKALYRFESEEIKYVAASWMLPSTSYQNQSSRSTVFSRTSFISEDSGRHRPYISHEVMDDSSD